jgi:hypothetical protein
MSRHTLIAEWNVTFRVPGLEDLEGATIKVQIDYSYSPGRRASWDDPGFDAEVSVLDATLLDGDGIDPDRATLLDWCQRFLEDEPGYDIACRNAEDER